MNANVYRKVVALALAALSIPAGVMNAQEYQYKLSEGMATITKYIGSGGTVSIPSTIAGLPVAYIGDGAFAGCTTLTSVTFPDTVFGIGHTAFNSCSALSQVSLGKQLYSIGDAAFAFCFGLESIAIPAGVTTIGINPFASCTNLDAITVEALNPSFSSMDGVLINDVEKRLIAYPAGKIGTTYTISDGVQSIGDSAFSVCSHLATITIASSVTNLGNSSFGNCIGLSSMVIPNSVISIDAAAFAGCTNLAVVTISDSVVSLGSSVFSGCIRLREAYFQGIAPQAGGGVFHGNEQATVYYLPGTAGWGATFCDRPTAAWVLPAPIILRTGPDFGFHNGAFGFVISWATNASVVIEASPSAANPAWSAVGTNALVGGWSHFSDPQSGSGSSRYYRIHAH